MSVSQYLRSYAEPEVKQLASFAGHYQQSLMVPVYREAVSALDYFCQFASRNPATLLTIVVNRPDSDKDTDWAKAFFSYPHQSNKALLWQAKNLSLFQLDNQSALLLVDRCVNGPPIPTDQGVGLARKIAADLLCQLIHQGQLQSHWIASTDADAKLPDNYFQQLPNNPDTAACLFAYQHRRKPHNLISQATTLYEFSLHYYVEGLRFAGSPYAFHTVGSTLAVNYRHYALVRGFPKRSAAEDFYLLNKLAKTGEIKSLTEQPIELQARLSNRNPFGTGPAVAELLASDNISTMPLYHPDSFVYLRHWLALLDRLTELNSGNIHQQIGTIEQLDQSLLLNLSEKFNLPKAISHCRRHGKEVATRQKQLKHWFDSFKTLKFIHCLRDQKLGTITLEYWLQHFPDYLLGQQQNLVKLSKKLMQ